jgi:hypothetical protein
VVLRNDVFNNSLMISVCSAILYSDLFYTVLCCIVLLLIFTSVCCLGV